MVYIFLISSMMFHFSKDVLLKNLIFDPFALDDKFYINGTSNIIRTSNGANKLARLEKYKLDARTAQFLLWFDRASSTSQMASIILRIRCRNIRIMWICGRLFVSADGSLVKIITKKASVSRIYLHRTRKVQRKKKVLKFLDRCSTAPSIQRQWEDSIAEEFPLIFIGFCGVRHSYERNLKMFCFFPSFSFFSNWLWLIILISYIYAYSSMHHVFRSYVRWNDCEYFQQQNSLISIYKFLGNVIIKGLKDIYANISLR